MSGLARSSTCPLPNMQLFSHYDEVSCHILRSTLQRQSPGWPNPVPTSAHSNPGARTGSALIGLDSRLYSRVYTKADRRTYYESGASDRIGGQGHYQKSGLLRDPARTAGGYRLFTETEIAELRFIARAQDLGFSLAEIKELASLKTENGRACPEVRALIHGKLQNVREKIAALRQLES